MKIEARGGGFASRSWRAEHRCLGGGSQGLILSPGRRVPRPLPWRSARPQARRSTLSVLSGAAGSRLRHGILPLSAAASCRRGKTFLRTACLPSSFPDRSSASQFPGIAAKMGQLPVPAETRPRPPSGYFGKSG